MNALTKFFNKSEDEIKKMLYTENDDGEQVLKDDAAQVLIDMDAARIKRIREESGQDGGKKFEEGYNKARKEVLTKFENDVRERFGITSDKTGIDLIAEYGEMVGKGGSITAEKIKTHPEFLKIEKEWRVNHEAEVEKVKNEFTEFRNNIERNQKLSKVKSVAEQEFLKLNPSLSEDPVKAKRQTEMFLSRFDGYDYDIVDNDIVVKKGDSRLEDGHGNPIGFGNLVKNEAEQLFDFRKQEDRGSPGNQTTGGSGSTRLTREEWNKKVQETGGDKQALLELSQKYTHE